MAKDTIGIDVSKDRLDAFWHSQDVARSLPNTVEGFTQLCTWLGEDNAVLVVFEATGAFVGIVGAGLIVFSRGKVHNITTAAHLWLAAAIGIACGAGQWPLVVIGSVIAALMLTVLRLVEPKDTDRRDRL